MSKEINVLIVEDQAITAENLKSVINELGYNVIGIVNNATDGITVLMEQVVDFVVLDINIQGDKNGIWLANYIKRMYKIPFIFLTAYSDEETISKAITTKPYGYLIKPFVKQNISAAIQIGLVNFTNNKTLSFSENQQQSQEGITKNSFFIKQKDNFIRVFYCDVYYLEAENNYVNIQTKDNSYLMRGTLKDVLKILPDYFIQVHRSFVANILNVTTVNTMTLTVETFTLPLGNSYKKELFKHINSI